MTGGVAEVEALLGEVMTTCEKIRTINAEGEAWLKTEMRKPGPMMVRHGGREEEREGGRQELRVDGSFEERMFGL